MMKDIVHYLIPFILITIIISCSQEEGLMSNEDATLQKIQEVTDKYLKAQNTTRTKAIDPAIAAIDIKTAIDTYNEDSSDIDWAITSGIAASAKASSGVMPVNPGIGFDNANNKYDYAGKYHVDILENQLTEKRDYVFQNGVFNYTKSVEVTKDILAEDNIFLNPLSIESPNEFLASYSERKQDLENVNNLLSETIPKMEQQGKISSLESQILGMYFKMQESANSLNTYVQYSVEVENLITNSNYTQATKRFLLFTMATARHDIIFWNPY